MLGPAGDAEFNWRLHGDISSTLNYTYRLFGGDSALHSSTASATDGLYQYEVHPTPGSVQTLSYDYITRDLFKPADWLPSTVYAGGSKVNSAGRNYSTTAGGTSTTVAPSGTDDFTDNDITWVYDDPTGVIDVVKETLNADTDLCIFDYELVKLGLKAHYMYETGGDYQAPMAEYQSKISKAVARYKGSFVGSMFYRQTGPRYHVPLKSWSI
jgi:hypothetical protein